jgi:hypothetical protein
MSMMRLDSGVLFRATLCAALCAGLPCLADVYVVDDDGGPGVDFTDIPPAILVAVPGDVLLVQAGSYSGFTLSEGLAIVGQGPEVVVTDQISVLGVATGQVAVLASMKLEKLLYIEHAQGTLVLDELEIASSSFGINAVQLYQDAPDVRARKLDVTFTTETSTTGFNSGAAISLDHSSNRLELVQSALQGRKGENTSSGLPASWGGMGLVVSGTGVAHVVSCAIAGGQGGASTAPCASAGPAGEGGDAVWVVGNARLISAGDGVTSFWRAGRGGEHACSPALSGAALFLTPNAFVRYSGTELQGALEGSGTLELPDPPDPYLELTDIPQPGGTIRFDVHGEPGDLVTLFLGRRPRVQHIPGVLIDG